MKILITGIAGMIGSNLARSLHELGHEVIGIDNYWRGSSHYLDYVFKDLCDPPIVHEHDLSKNSDNWKHLFAGIDCVFHLADVVAGIGYIFNNQGWTFRQNLLINANVVNAVSEFNCGRYVYVGTACSFPRSLQLSIDSKPLVENDLFPALPESAYGWSKLMGHLDSTYLSEENHIPSVNLIFHNVYGSPCDYSEKSSQVIPSLCRKFLLEDSDEVVVWGNGLQGRAFVHVKDVVQSLLKALVNGDDAGPIQIGPNHCTSIKEIALTIKELVSSDKNIVYDTSKPIGDIGRCADFSKAKELLDWTPSVSIKEGLEDVLDWIRYEETNVQL